MDRVFVYPTELPRSQDFLMAQKNALVALGAALQTMLGTSTCVNGLVGAQSTVPDLHITIGTGSLYTQGTLDTGAYGVLGTDSSVLIKQGLLSTPQVLTLTPPSTTGYSQVYLVQASYSDVDSGFTILPYFNSANPTVAWNGPGGLGSTQPTLRQGACNISLKAGTAAPTGSQTTPATDAGCVPLYTITLANGQTAITNAQIVTVSGAPFVPYNLNNLPFLKSQTDTGTANALVVTVPTISALFVGLTLTVKKSALPNTGTTTLNVNGLGAVSLVWPDGSSLVGGDWPASVTGIIEYDGTQWNLLSVMGPSVYLRHGAQRGIAAYSTAGTFSWTCPAGVYWVKAIVTGAGGGGQGTSVGSSGASGGAGGSGIKVMPVVPGTSYTVVVGVGGWGGGPGGGAGGGGGTSSFNGISAIGGGGAAVSVGGWGGWGSGSDDNLAGGDGVDGNPSAADQSTTGGASIWGGGSSGGNPGPATGGAPGSGGGGAYGSAGSGNTGNPGKVYLEY